MKFIVSFATILLFCHFSLASISSPSIYKFSTINNLAELELNSASGKIDSESLDRQGYAVFLEKVLDVWLSWEFGLVYKPYKYKVTTNGNSVVHRFDSIELPLNMRIALLTDIFWLGFGVYARQGFGNYYRQAPGQGEYGQSFADVNLRSFDYGTQWSAALEFPAKKSWSLFFEFRNNSSLANSSTANGVTGHFKSMYALIGIRLGERYFF